jgi:DNA-directed RNA polymerase specialized sigma24 family protein
LRHETRLKRGGGHVLGDTSPRADDDSDHRLGLVLSREPTTEAAARFAEDYQVLLDHLPQPALRAITVRKLEGFSSAEIAAELGVTARTIDRKLQLIREIWAKEVEG